MHGTPTGNFVSGRFQGQGREVCAPGAWQEAPLRTTCAVFARGGAPMCHSWAFASAILGNPSETHMSPPPKSLSWLPLLCSGHRPLFLQTWSLQLKATSSGRFPEPLDRSVPPGPYHCHIHMRDPGTQFILPPELPPGQCPLSLTAYHSMEVTLPPCLARAGCSANTLQVHTRISDSF